MVFYKTKNSFASEDEDWKNWADEELLNEALEETKQENSNKN